MRAAAARDPPKVTSQASSEDVSVYDRLAEITKDDDVYSLSLPEAKRRLAIAAKSVLLVQCQLRLWIAHIRALRESYKVTTRSALHYSSHSPKDARLEALRRTRVSEHGWRAPLTKKYMPLGSPRLDLERKPDWAVQPDSDVDHQLPDQGDVHTFIAHGETVRGSVLKYRSAYFQTYMYDAKAQLIVTVEALSGDPDLFLSRSVMYPDSVKHTWSSHGIGADSVEILPTDRHFGLGQYYIAVCGSGKAAECVFTISVRTKKHARHANWSSADDAAAVRRLAEDTAAADGRRRRVASGGCTAELIAEAQKKVAPRSPLARLRALLEFPRMFPSSLPVMEVAERLCHLIRPRYALALGKEGAINAHAPTPEWVCQLLAYSGSAARLQPSEQLLCKNEPATFIAFVLQGQALQLKVEESDGSYKSAVIDETHESAAKPAAETPASSRDNSLVIARASNFTGSEGEGRPAAQAPSIPSNRADAADCGDGDVSGRGDGDGHDEGVREREDDDDFLDGDGADGAGADGGSIVDREGESNAAAGDGGDASGTNGARGASLSAAAAPSAADASRRVYAEGSLLGDELLHGRGSTRSSDLAAGVSGCDVLTIRLDTLRKLLEVEPESAECLLRMLAICSGSMPYLAVAAEEMSRAAGKLIGARQRARRRHAQGVLVGLADQMETQLRELTEHEFEEMMSKPLAIYSAESVVEALATAEDASAGAPSVLGRDKSRLEEEASEAGCSSVASADGSSFDSSRGGAPAVPSAMSTAVVAGGGRGGGGGGGGAGRRASAGGGVGGRVGGGLGGSVEGSVGGSVGGRGGDGGGGTESGAGRSSCATDGGCVGLSACCSRRESSSGAKMSLGPGPASRSPSCFVDERRSTCSRRRSMTSSASLPAVARRGAAATSVAAGAAGLKPSYSVTKLSRPQSAATLFFEKRDKATRPKRAALQESIRALALLEDEAEAENCAALAGPAHGIERGARSALRWVEAADAPASKATAPRHAALNGSASTTVLATGGKDVPRVQYRRGEALDAYYNMLNESVSGAQAAQRMPNALAIKASVTARPKPRSHSAGQRFNQHQHQQQLQHQHQHQHQHQRQSDPRRSTSGARQASPGQTSKSEAGAYAASGSDAEETIDSLFSNLDGASNSSKKNLLSSSPSMRVLNSAAAPCVLTSSALTHTASSPNGPPHGGLVNNSLGVPLFKNLGTSSDTSGASKVKKIIHAQEQAAKLKYVKSEFEQAKSDRGRELCASLDQLAEARRDAYAHKLQEVGLIGQPGSPIKNKPVEVFTIGLRRAGRKGVTAYHEEGMLA